MPKIDKHLRARIDTCHRLACLSNCPRHKIAAVLYDPERKQVVAEGYNGGPRGGGALCGGDRCLRDVKQIESGTHMEIGCHHAEMNVICNAAASGVATRGSWIIVTGEPCTLCAKLIHHAGITRVIVVDGGYGGANGIEYLEGHGVDVLKVAADL